jgi:4-hydroxy-tetrahydrodipicolinate reductase
MGQRLVALAHADERFELVAALESDRHPRLGQDAGELAGVGPIGVCLASQQDAPWEAIDVVIDFSVPAAAMAVLEQAVAASKPLVVATTGFEEAQREQIVQASSKVPIVFAPSMSLAVNLVMKLAQTTAQVLRELPTGVDVEILERHHRFKEDAPSGTALKFGEIVSQAMGISAATHGRSGRPGVRPRDEIGYHAIRVGDNPGEHTIVFGMLGETIELRVAASNRDCYASGALQAAHWLVSQPPGLYGMNDVLGL